MVDAPGAFFSYSHLDNDFTGGKIARLRDRLQDAIQVHSGIREFRIFLDTDIGWGGEWERVITESLDAEGILFPIISPGWFSSRNCRDELTTFLTRRERLPHSNLILPVYYVPTSLMHGCDAILPEEQRAAAEILRTFQFEDWRKLREEAEEGDAYRAAIEKLAQRAASSLAELRKAGFPATSYIPPKKTVTLSGNQPQSGASSKNHVVVPRPDPDDIPPAKRTPRKQRRYFLAELAYAYLRLDQLPSGGWSKGLAHWMEEIWRGDDGTTPRNPEMRSRGGTDLTCFGLLRYLALFDHLHEQFVYQRQLRNNEVVSKALANLSQRIGPDGGSGSVISRFGHSVKYHIRHSLLSLSAMLQCASVLHNNLASDTECLADYVLTNLSKWQEEKSDLWGLYAGTCYLQHQIEVGRAHEQISQSKLKNIHTALKNTRQSIRKELAAPVHFDPIPYVEELRTSQFVFTPYFNFWRMERYSFLTHLSLILETDLEDSLDANLRQKCQFLLEELLEEVQYPLVEASPSDSLIRFHRQPDQQPGLTSFSADRDWGLSAELLAILRHPNFMHHLHAESIVRDARINTLSQALLATFDQYHAQPQIFRFTHGISFARILDVAGELPLPTRAMTATDRCLTEVMQSEGVSERAVHTLVAGLRAVYPDAINDQLARSIEDMLVDKLEPGEYVTGAAKQGDGRAFLGTKDLARVRESTIFHSDREPYIKNYGVGNSTLVDRLPSITGLRFDGGQMRAMDLGSGPGRDAALLRALGFTVTLVDASQAMLDEAKAYLGEEKAAFPIDIFDMHGRFQPEEFDLIFANAILIHVPPKMLPRLLQELYQWLKPGGVFFCNFKIGDHSLVSRDGRHFAYYRDYRMPFEVLQSAGFNILEVALRWNDRGRNLYGDPRKIRWANFYCKRPANERAARS